MKTIIIPKRFGYPTLDITVNGKVYTVKSGEEITIEDHLAEAIENAMALVPKAGRNKSKIAMLADGVITDITIDDLEGVEKIAFYAFAHCYSLESVEIPGTVKNIKNSAFDSCTNLNRVYLPEIPPTLGDPNAFNGVKDTCVFYCKTKASLEAYKAALNWRVLTSMYTFMVKS